MTNFSEAENAVRAGRRAAAAGLSVDINPCPRSERLWKIWRTGWFSFFDGCDDADATADREAVMYDFDATVTRMKAEVLADIKAGNVPADVASFSHLHDFVDANCYGGAENFDLAEVNTDAFCSFWNRAQNAVDAWLKAGRPEVGP